MFLPPITDNISSDVDHILSAPETQDEGVWKYEHLRQFCMELNGLAVKLQSECKPETCSQMTATEQWIFLCAAHKTPKECPAIDYTRCGIFSSISLQKSLKERHFLDSHFCLRHTLDGAACLLNSNKYFPSRVSIKESSVAKLGSVCRRVYRIFSHAYFHHRCRKIQNCGSIDNRVSFIVGNYLISSRTSLTCAADSRCS